MLSEFGLKRDPFTIVPDGTVNNWAGRKGLKEELMDIMRGVRSTDMGSSEFIVLYGELGSGKSHALRFLKTQIEENSNDFKSLAIYVERPRVAAKLNFLELYKYIMAEIGMDEVQ